MSRFRHYEIVLLFNLDNSEQLPQIIERYTSMITKSGGKIHRQEDWGRRALTYQIAKQHKAHYILLNIECDDKTLNELTYNFRFSDAVLRHLVVKCDRAISEISPMLHAIRAEQAAQQAQANMATPARIDEPKADEIEVVAAFATEAAE